MNAPTPIAFAAIGLTKTKTMLLRLLHTKYDNCLKQESE
jgi:hypothetical protein